MEWGRSTEGDIVPVGELGQLGEPEPASSTGGGRRRVLVCDDLEQIRRLIRVNLELEGYEVIEAEDGQQALEILWDRTQPLPDVMTVDVIMPRRDGWSTVSAIRADPRLAHIPIIMVTGSVQNADRERAARVDVDAFVAKPFEPSDLMALIETLAEGPPRVTRADPPAS